jgi:hypothetical protein
MSAHRNIRLRKTTDIQREHALFELLVDNVPILDLGFSNSGRFEVSFNQAIIGMILEWELVEEWVNKGREMAIGDKA